jgi:hypothetical protein
MLLDRQVQRLFSDLLRQETITFPLGPEDVVVRIFDSATKISLSVPVYHGDQYIPQSVRRCVTKNVPLSRGLIGTFLALDEPQYQVNLNYLGADMQLDPHSFKQLLEEFNYIAQEWRYILDENDRNDLVHVRVS